jgi:hypothetical protein
MGYNPVSRRKSESEMGMLSRLELQREQPVHKTSNCTHDMMLFEQVMVEKYVVGSVHTLNDINTDSKNLGWFSP